jgi:hypothetical protein
MSHPIHSVKTVAVVAPYTLRVGFADDTTQTINLEPVLRGELYGPLRDDHLFRQVRIDPEAHTVVWPNGADFDPATLHDWPTHGPALAAQAQRWPSLEKVS